MEPRPGIVISPTGIGEVLDAGFNLARRNYRLLLGLGAWGVAPATALSALASAPAALDPNPIGAMLLTGLGTLVSAVGAALSTGALLIACARLVSPTGQPNELAAWAVYKAVIARIGHLILLAIIATLVGIPLIIVLPLGIYIGVRWSQSYIAILVERVGPIASLSRSWELTGGSWWHAAVVLFLASLTVGTLSFAVGGILGGGAALLGMLTGSPVLASVLTTLGSAAGTLVLMPFSEAISVVLYFELRARVEGFDIQQRATQVAPTA